jgi:DNA-binding transcriptional LysR family regulator
MAAFDWDHIRSFIAVARCGRLTVAASRMRTDHTTISRRITVLEQALESKLFDRSPTGYALTDQGKRLMPIAEQMEALASLAADVVGGAAKAIEGPVRIAGPEGFCSYFLAPRLAQLTELHPGLNVQLVAGPNNFSLSKREADLAITLSRPSEGRLVAQKLTDYELGLYAAKSYLASTPPIQRRGDLRHHNFVGYIGDLLQIPELDYLDQVDAGVVPRLESSNLLVQVKATVSGAGLCVLPAFIAVHEPSLVPILPEEIGLVRSFWLTIHTDNRDRTRVQLAARFIVDQVRCSRGVFLKTRKPAESPPLAAAALSEFGRDMNGGMAAFRESSRR